MARPKTDIRERLLASTMEYVATRGVGEMSLRQLAAALGTSHRVLIFHFGSKDALFAEVVQTVELQQRTFLDELIARMAQEDPPGDAVDLMWRMWERVSDPELAPYVRLFFELSGQALQGRESAVPLLDSLIVPWLKPVEQMLISGGAPPGHVEEDARAAVATVRGLLLDLLVTDDRAAVEKTMVRFLDYWRAAWAVGA